MIELPDLKFELYYDSQKYDVYHSPIGWNECEFGIDLDQEQKTTRTKFESELTFVYDSARLLRSILYSKGARAEVLLRVLKLDKTTPSLEYKQEVLLSLDLESFKDTQEGFTCGLKEISIQADVDAFIDVAYSIPVSEGPVKTNIGGIGVAQFGQFVAAEQFTVIGGLNAFSPSMSIVEETTDTDIVELQSDYPEWSGYLGGDIGDSWFAKAVASFTGRVQGSISANGAGWVRGQKFYFYIREQETDTNYLIKGPVNPVFLYPFSAGSPLNTYYNPIEFDFDINIPFVAGRKYTLIIHSDRANLPTAYALGFNTVSLKLDYRTYTVDYKTTGIKASSLFKSLIQRISPNNTAPVLCPVLEDGQWDRLVMLSGDCIRGVPNATIQTSLRDFLKSMNAEVFSGFKIYKDGSTELDTLDQFFNRYIGAGYIGVVKNARYEVIQEAHFTKLLAGYEDQEYQTVDGKDEFNTETNWSVVGSKTKASFDLKSVYRADPRGIDQLLIDFRAQLTKDKDSDKQVFMVQIKEEPNEDGYYSLQGVEQYKKVEGVSALGRIYNLNLSPRSMISRHSGLLSVQFALDGQGKIKFQSSKKNSGLKITKVNDTVISEKDPFFPSNMNSPLYLPIKCTFTCSLTDSQYKNIVDSAENSGGYITFTDRGVDLKGFIVSSKFNLTSDNIKEFIVYLTPDNDLTKIVNS